MYNRQIEDPDDVLPLIRWYGLPSESDNPSTELLYNLFIIRLVHWISGTGHPRELVERGLIASESYEKYRHDTGFRARLFYEAVSGSHMRLIGAGRDKVHVRVTVSALFLVNAYNVLLGENDLR